MGRRRPTRGQQFYRRPVSVRGLPLGTIQALDQLAEPESSAAAVADALDQWRWYIEIPAGPRRLEKDPYDEWVGESARIRLDAAVAALVGAGVGVSAAGPRGRLEDAFLELVGPEGRDVSGGLQ